MRYLLLASTLLAEPALAQSSMCPPSKRGFTVTANGFTDPSGQPWSMRGMNMDVADAMPMMRGQFFQNFPGTTAIRLVTNPERDDPQTLDEIVLYYTGKGIVLEIEDHADTQNGQNISWYSQVAERYKTNALIFLETPNEPSPAMTGGPQANIINAVRATGFNNPIGIQPIGGYDQSNIPAVLGGVTSPDNLYVTPHVYCSSMAGPSCPTGYTQAAAQSSNGLFHVIDEFGDAMDGFTRDAYGLQVITAVTDIVNSGRAGGTFWHAGNGFHGDGADSACLEQGCGKLSQTGQMLRPWLSANSPSGSCPLVTQAALPAATHATIDTLNNQIQQVQAQAATPPPPPQGTQTPNPTAFTGYNPQFVQYGQQAQQQLQAIQAGVAGAQSQLQNLSLPTVTQPDPNSSPAPPQTLAPTTTQPQAQTTKKRRPDNDGDADDQ